jgi:probable HAF family extracellular repeat protein
VFTDLTLPSNVNSQAVGINNAGDIVGFYQPTSTTALGFLDVGGTITTVDPFSSSFAQALGVSNTGEIVGLWVDNMGANNGFVDIGGVFTTFDVAGASSTVVNGVNDKGQIVGFFVDANGNTDGFVATPIPEPAVWTLALAGFGGLGVALRSRRRTLTA